MSGWLIISSKQNLDITSSLNYTQQGLKKRHRKKAQEIEPGDYFFFYITGKQKLAGVVKIESFATEASDHVWVNLGKDPQECYPWRFQISPHIILDEQRWLSMSDFSDKLLHFKKWPAKNWRLGLQGQIHALREEDTQFLLEAIATK
ncbi:MAG: EVE domain-containing protein [Candidatus Marinimicrobia bacterium]|nr:EVE domain-containing protein [Candidatus Neomarinimicrobiota bacterium]